ncbi:UNVERIFIED_CONTAM: hypothetical protein RMT77_018616 [Armadillidium vulgare]
MDETNLEFPDILYDMKENFILYRELVRLDLYSIILSTSYYLKRLNILTELDKIDFEKEDVLSDSKIICLIQGWLKIILDKVLEIADSRLKLLKTHVAFTIELVLVQAISFYKIAKIYIMKEKNIFIKNLVFTTQGTVNPRKTAIKVLSNEDLSHEREFKLAAYFFLSEEIVQHYFNNLTNPQKLSFRVDIDEDFTCYYWIWIIERSRKAIKDYYACTWSEKGKKLECRSDIMRNDFTLQNIFRRAVKHHNECAVQYLWTTYISYFRERQLLLEECICEYYNKPTHTNIIIYLISKSRLYEMTDVYITKGFKIQMLFYDNKRWIDLFFEILVKIQIYFEDYQYFFILRNIANSYPGKDPNDVDLRFLKYFFLMVPIPQRNMLENCDDSWKTYYQLLRVVFANKDEDLAKLFLDSCERSKIFRFFLSHYGMELIESIISKFYHNFADEILNTYLSKNRLRQVKSKFFSLKSFDLCFNCLLLGTDVLTAFVDWFQDSVDFSTIHEFKSKFPYANSGKIVKYLLFSLREYPYCKPTLYTQKILEWCVGYDNIDMIKSKILLRAKEEEDGDEFERPVIKCYENVTELVLESNWELLNEILTWVGNTTDEKQTLGRKLLQETSLFEEILKKTDGLNYIYEFSDWLKKDLCIKEKDECIKNFRTKVFKTIKLFLNPLIMKCDLEGIKRAIIWCNQPARKSKSLRKDIIEMVNFYKLDTDEANKEFNEFSKWFKKL